MAYFKSKATAAPEQPIDSASPTLPPAPAATKDGARDFWLHWDYVLGLVPELAAFGVPVLEAVGLTLQESILAEQPVGDVPAGGVLIEKGTRVQPRMLGLLTGMGIQKVLARPAPRVLVMALSKEAIPASYLVAGQAQAAGAQAYRMEYIFPTAAETIPRIMEQLVRGDLIITVGGLGEAGVDLTTVADQIGPHDFTPVAVSPGRDHGFALAEGKIPLLAVPADVYSTFVLTKLLIEPMIAKLMGASTDPALFSAYLAQPLKVPAQIVTCVPAIVADARMRITGRPVGLEGLNQIYQANALAILSAEDGLIAADAEAFYLPLK